MVDQINNERARDFFLRAQQQSAAAPTVNFKKAVIDQPQKTAVVTVGASSVTQTSKSAAPASSRLPRGSLLDILV